MSVGKGSMARASKAVKKTIKQTEELKQPEAEEISEKKEENTVAKKTTTKKKEKAEAVQENKIIKSIIAVGDEMPVYYL